MASQTMMSSGHQHAARHRHHNIGQRSPSRLFPVEWPREQQVRLTRTPPAPTSTSSTDTNSNGRNTGSSRRNKSSNSSGGNSRQTIRGKSMGGAGKGSPASGSNIQTQLHELLAAFHPIAHTRQAKDGDTEAAAAALRQLAHLWSLYVNVTAQQAQHASSHPARLQLVAEDRAGLDEVHQQVRAVGLALGRQVVAAVPGTIASPLLACQLLVSSVHAMGALGVYDAAIHQAVDAHIVQYSQAGLHLELRQGAQLLAAYAKLGHAPTQVCLHSIIRMTTYAMDAAAQTAAAVVGGTALAHTHHAAEQAIPASHSQEGGARKHEIQVANTRKHPKQVGSIEKRASRLQSHSPRLQPGQGQAQVAAAAGGGSRGQGTEAVRLQAGARALVDLAEALAMLIPGCLRPATVFTALTSTAPVSVAPSAPASQQQAAQATASSDLISGPAGLSNGSVTIAGRTAASNLAATRVPSSGHHVARQQASLASPAVTTAAAVNAAVLLLPPGMHVAAPIRLPPVTAAIMAQVTTPSDPLMTLLPDSRSSSRGSSSNWCPQLSLETNTRESPSGLIKSNVQSQAPVQDFGHVWWRQQPPPQADLRQADMLAALAAWNINFQAAAAMHVPALNLSGLCSLVHACSALGMVPTSAWWTAVTTALADAMARSSISAVEPNKLSLLVPALEALAWMHLDSLQQQQGRGQRQPHSGSSRLHSIKTSWLAGEPRPVLPPAFKQALQGLLRTERVKQCSHQHLAPLLWSALILIGTEGIPTTASASVYMGGKATGYTSAGRAQQSLASAQQSDAPATQLPTQTALSAGATPACMPSDWEHAVLQQLQGQLPMMQPQHTAQALHVAALLGVRPHPAWMYMMQHQIQRHESSYTDAAIRQLVWSLAILHAPHLQPDSPTTTSLIHGLTRALPLMPHTDVWLMQQCLRRMFRKLTSRPLRELMQRLEERAEYTSAHVL